MAQRGRPRKTLNLDETKAVNYLEEIKSMKTVKSVMRFISNVNISNPATGEASGAEWDALINANLADGYDIWYITYVGSNPNGYGVLVTFVKEA